MIEKVYTFLWGDLIKIPLPGGSTLGISLLILLLIPTGIYFTIRTKLLPIRLFPDMVRALSEKKSDKNNLSAFQTLIVSTATRVGMGNLVGVVAAISAGGAGAVFWMWITALIGSSTAFIEATLAQLYKEKDPLYGGYRGGPAYYIHRYWEEKQGRKRKKVLLSVLFAISGLICWCGISQVISNSVTASFKNAFDIPPLYTTIVLVVIAAVIVLRKNATVKVLDLLVPVMAVLYMVVVLLLIILNFTRIPYFFGSVFAGAFKPDAFFGGVFGTVLAQGVKRGLMSNEAGQGTITMSAAAADAKHPCEQGVIASLGVFLDTIVICTLTGFVVVMAHCWTGADAESWQVLDKLPKYTESIAVLTPGTAMNGIVTFLVTLCFCLFAFTCLLGMISFSEIAANRIRKDKICINFVRCIGLFVAAFGILCNIAGLELGNLWAFSDLGNILIVFFNVPIVYVGAKYVFRATRHYKKNDGTPFTSEVIGRNDCAYWDEQAKKAVKNFSGK